MIIRPTDKVRKNGRIKRAQLYLVSTKKITMKRKFRQFLELKYCDAHLFCLRTTASINSGNGKLFPAIIMLMPFASTGTVGKRKKLDVCIYDKIIWNRAVNLNVFSIEFRPLQPAFNFSKVSHELEIGMHDKDISPEQRHIKRIILQNGFCVRHKSHYARKLRCQTLSGIFVYIRMKWYAAA